MGPLRKSGRIAALATLLAGAVVGAAGARRGHESAPDGWAAGNKPLSFLDDVDSGRLRQTTLPHDTGRFAAIGESILIGEGDSPLGAYELGAYAVKPPTAQDALAGGANVAMCIDLDFPSRREAPNANRTCFQRTVETWLRLNGLSRSGRKGGGFVLSGKTSPRVQFVIVTYVRSDGRTISASGSYGVVTSKVAKATGIRARAGQLIAFLPRKAVMPTGAEHGLDRAPSLEVSVTDIDGYVVDQDRWGER